MLKLDRSFAPMPMSLTTSLLRSLRHRLASCTYATRFVPLSAAYSDIAMLCTACAHCMVARAAQCSALHISNVKRRCLSSKRVNGTRAKGAPV